MSTTHELEQHEGGREMTLFRGLEHEAGLPDQSIGMLGLTLTDPDMPFEKWESIGRAIGHAYRWTRWGLGDWINFGAALYGEEHAQATESTRDERYDVAARVTGLAPGTLSNYASVAERIPISRRRVELDMTTHEPAARLEADEQVEWLQRCVDESWSREEFRRAIIASRTPDGGVVPEDPAPAALPEVPFNERLLEVASLIYHQAQRNSSGDVIVPAEAWAQLTALLDDK